MIGATGEHSIPKNFLIIAMEKIFGVLAAFISLILASRFFEPAEYGNMLIALALVTSFIYIYTLNLNQIVLKEFVSKGDSKTVISTVVFLRFFASIVSFLLVNIISYVFLYDAYIYVLILSVSILFTPYESFELYMHSKERFFPGSAVRSLVYIISIFLQLAVIYFELDFIFLIIAIFLERALVGIVFIVFFRSFRSKIKVKYFSTTLSRNFLSSCWKELLTGIFMILMMRFPLFYIGYTGSDTEKALFGTALRVMDVFLTVMQAYSKSIMPIFFKKFHENIPDAMIFFKKQLGIYLITILFAILLSLFLSDDLFMIFFGLELLEASKIFNILVFLPYIHAFAIMSGCLLIAKNRIIVNTSRTFLGLFTCLLTTPYLINKFGLLGGAYAVIISSLLCFLVYSFFSKDLKYISSIKAKAFLTAGLIYLK